MDTRLVELEALGLNLQVSKPFGMAHGHLPKLMVWSILSFKKLCKATKQVASSLFKYQKKSSNPHPQATRPDPEYKG